MTKNYLQSRDRALEFTARFGFITRDLFFEYICPLKRALKYYHWAALQEEGLIYVSRTLSDVFYLTRKGRLFYSKPSAPARSIYFIPHDKIVGQILLSLKASGFVENYWTERDLKTDRLIACSILGTGQLLKYPDLVIDMKGANRSLRVALEVERSQKAAFRYDQISMAYISANRIGLLVFACSTKGTVSLIERAFQGELFQKAAKVPATFLLNDFSKSGIDANATFMGRQLKLRRLILAALQRPESDWQNNMDKTWKVVHGLSMKSKGIA
ncbi:MAG TPA: hypothetical protein VIG33_10685 [Pseudobdellovibrionaceae bacterium]|jgi:hypothetical protein